MMATKMTRAERFWKHSMESAVVLDNVTPHKPSYRKRFRKEEYQQMTKKRRDRLYSSVYHFPTYRTKSSAAIGFIVNNPFKNEPSTSNLLTRGSRIVNFSTIEKFSPPSSSGFKGYSMDHFTVRNHFVKNYVRNDRNIVYTPLLSSIMKNARPTSSRWIYSEASYAPEITSKALLLLAYQMDKEGFFYNVWFDTRQWFFREYNKGNIDDELHDRLVKETKSPDPDKRERAVKEARTAFGWHSKNPLADKYIEVDDDKVMKKFTDYLISARDPKYDGPIRKDHFFSVWNHEKPIIRKHVRERFKIIMKKYQSMDLSCEVLEEIHEQEKKIRPNQRDAKIFRLSMDRLRRKKENNEC